MRVYGQQGPDPASILKGPNYNVAAHYQRVRALYDAYPYRTVQQCDKHSVTVIKAIFKKVRPLSNEELLFSCVDLYREILEDEGIYCPRWSLSLDADTPATHIEFILKPHLTEDEHFYTDAERIVSDVIKAFTIFMPYFFNNLPQLVLF
jgi:hypothetical protein